MKQTENELHRVEEQRLRSEKLEALGTLAAGAAHELATLLSTIAVVSNELTHELTRLNLPQSVLHDISLVRTEVQHCQTILSRMTGRAGQQVTEEYTSLTPQELIQEVIKPLPDISRVSWSVSKDARTASLSIPRESVGQAIIGVVQNALEATRPNGPVRVDVELEKRFLRIRVSDQGPGMTSKTLARAGDPFFTTKEPNKGMGLGLFLTRSVIERVSGTMKLWSRPGEGVIVDITLPISEIGSAAR